MKAYVIRRGSLGRPGRLALAALLTFSLFGSGFSNIGLAHADEADAQGDVPKTAYELAQELELTQAAYDEARWEAERADADVAANEQLIADLERDLPKQQRRSAEAARDLYKYQQRSGGLVELLLESDSFFGFLAELDYMNRVAEININEMNQLSEMRKELADVQRGLLAKQAEASVRAEEARAAWTAAEEAKAEAERRAAEEAALAAQVEVLAAQLAEEPRDNDEVVIEDAPSGGENAGPSAAPERDENAAGSNGSKVDQLDKPATVDNSDVSMWAARIDAYLAGSPLAGQGLTFAQAAFEYGVDPRFSPAISCTESSKGLYCFRSHNAWGWGSSSWETWEEAIRAHVRGLARGYGYTISVEGAKKYCPPNWEFWYEKTLAQMNLI